MILAYLIKKIGFSFPNCLNLRRNILKTIKFKKSKYCEKVKQLYFLMNCFNIVTNILFLEKGNSKSCSKNSENYNQK